MKTGEINIKGEKMSEKYTRGFIFGALIGGAVGAITALLLAPKSGEELRKDIAEKSRDLADKGNEVYSKAQKYFKEKDVEFNDSVRSTVNEGRMKAENIVKSAKSQADEILQSAERIFSDAKYKTSASKDAIQEKMGKVKSAFGESVEAFKQEMNS